MSDIMSVQDAASSAASQVAPTVEQTATDASTMQPTAAGTPVPTQPTTQSPAPQNQPHPLSRALDAVLKGATGGDVYYTDPSGQRKLAPQSRGTLGKTLIAATLAGLLAPDKYRDTPYGPVRDFSGTAANAADASLSKVNEMRNRPQKLSDDAQTRKLMTIQNNSNLIALQSASARMKHQNQQDNASAVETTLSPFKEYESLRTSNNDPNQPKAFESQGLTHDQVLAKGSDGKPAHKLTDSNVIQDGWTEKWNEGTEQMEPEPTYAVLNPALKDVTLPKNVTDMLDKVNSQWKDIHSIVGGTVRVPVNAYVSAMHDYSAVMQGQQILDALNNAVNGKDAKPLTVDAVASAARMSKDKGANILPALYQLSHAVAGGNLPEDGQRPDNLLHTLLTSPNGAEILKLIGLTPEQASQKADGINAERVKQLALAKEGGIGDKSPADPAKVGELPRLAAALGLTPEQSAIAGVKPNMAGMTQGEYIKAVDKIQSQANTNAEIEIKKLQQGDPAVQARTANDLIEGDVAKLDKITNTRGEARERLMNTIHDEAERRGLDTTQYSPAALENKSNTWNDYNGNKKGTTGSQISSFNAFLGHTAGAVDAEKRLAGKTLGLMRTPWVNTALDTLGKQVTDDPDWKAYKTSLIPVQTEISNFLAAGYAVKEEDARLMNQAVDPHETPARITAALRQLAETADIRLQSIGQRYLDTMGTTYPKLLSSDSANTLKRLGINSRAAAISQQIPRGWKNDKASQPTQQVLNTIFSAAGRDPKVATEIARQNGWAIADSTR
jgi:hypothetical protein